MKSLQMVTINCFEGPESEQFSAIITAHSSKCDICGKAEQLLRVSAICNRKPRPFRISFTFDDESVLAGEINSQFVDINQRGFITRLLSELQGFVGVSASVTSGVRLISHSHSV
jgi:hypothetical protein